MHIGSIPQAGHYVSYARTAKGWYEFDDTLVNYLIQCQYHKNFIIGDTNRPF